MSLRTAQDGSQLAGVTMNFTAADAAGDTVAGGQGVQFFVNNASTAAITVTLVTPETVEGALAVADRAVTVMNGTIREIPVPARYNDAATGLASITYSAAASVTVCAMRGPVSA